MPSVTGFTSERTKAIEDAMITSATVNASGLLIFTQFNGHTLEAGLLMPPQIPHTNAQAIMLTAAPTSRSLSAITAFTNPVSLVITKLKADTKLIVQAYTNVWNTNPMALYEVWSRVTVTGLSTPHDTVLFTGPGTSGAKSGARAITGIPAGSVTVSLMMKCGNTPVLGEVSEGYIYTRNELLVTETY